MVNDYVKCSRPQLFRAVSDQTDGRVASASPGHEPGSSDGVLRT